MESDCHSAFGGPLMLERLRDVEQQLWRAATAVQLHVRLVGGAQESEDAETLKRLCERVEQVQSQLMQSTTEIVTLARSRLECRRTAEDDGEDTETEDEGDEEDCDVEPKGAAVDGMEMRVTQEEKGVEIEENGGVEEMADVIVVERRSRDVGEAAVGGVTEDLLPDSGLMWFVEELEYARDKVISTSVQLDEKRDKAEEADEVMIQAEKAAGWIPDVTCSSHENTVKEVYEQGAMKSEDSSGGAPGMVGGVVNVQKLDLLESTNDSGNVQTGNYFGENGDCSHKHFNSSASEAKRSNIECKTNGGGAFDSGSQVKHEKNKETDSKLFDDVPADNVHVTTIYKKLDSPSCVIKRSTCIKLLSRSIESVVCTDLRHSLQTGRGNPKAIAAFNMFTAKMMSGVVQRDPKLSSRVMIERLLEASRANLAMTTRPDFLESFAPVIESASCLQKYCDAHYPDYLQDMLYDFQSFEYLKTKYQDTHELGSLLRLLVDQLQLDCVRCSTLQTGTNANLRTEQQWNQLVIVCDRLSDCIRQMPANSEQISASYMTETVKLLGEFDVKYPRRIPMVILESMISIVQDHKSEAICVKQQEGRVCDIKLGGDLKRSESKVDDMPAHRDAKTSQEGCSHENTAMVHSKAAFVTPSTTEFQKGDTELSPLSTAINERDYKKRSRPSDGPSLKKLLRSESLAKINLLARRYLGAAHEAKQLIVYIRLPTATKKYAQAISALKTTATDAITAFRDFLDKGDTPDQNTVDCLVVGTQSTASTILSVPGHAIQYTWLVKITTDLRKICWLGSCLLSKKDRDSLSTSTDTLYSYLGGAYGLDKGERSLRVMEKRARRFQKREHLYKKFTAIMGPVHSISEAFLNHLGDHETKTEGRYLLWNDKSWGRAVAVGGALTGWMSRALQCQDRGSFGFFKQLLARLQMFEKHHPAKLPPLLLSNARLLSTPTAPKEKK